MNDHYLVSSSESDEQYKARRLRELTRDMHTARNRFHSLATQYRETLTWTIKD